MGGSIDCLYCLVKSIIAFIICLSSELYYRVAVNDKTSEAELPAVTIKRKIPPNLHLSLSVFLACLLARAIRSWLRFLCSNQITFHTASIQIAIIMFACVMYHPPHTGLSSGAFIRNRHLLVQDWHNTLSVIYNNVVTRCQFPRKPMQWTRVTSHNIVIISCENITCS